MQARRFWLTLIVVSLLQTLAFAQDAQWAFTGNAAADASKDRTGNGGAIKVAPAGKAVLKLRPTDGAGKVEMWVFDDLTKPADPKERRQGPRWGLQQSDGRVLVIGAIYAPYLDGATTFATNDSDGKSWYTGIQYSALPRATGWHKWTFDFDADKGLSITMDNKKARFDWNNTKIKGFSAIVVLGDEKAADGQTIWVDDVQTQLGGPVTAQPKPAAAPAGAPAAAAPAALAFALPASDPAPEKPVALVPAVAGKHPRLLFTAKDLPRLRANMTGVSKPFYDRFLAYLPASKPPTDNKFLTDATEGQRVGLWRLPTVALHYVLTGDKKSLETSTAFLRKLNDMENWETGAEIDSGMSVANIMIGAALAYDWTYNDLDPAFRDAFGKKLLLHARRMYYGGHLMKTPGTHYWQNDPQNNHRWHRDGGMALCILAVAGEQPGSEWLLSKTKEELEFITRWLPEDGSSHESSSYLVFGAPHLTLALDAADRCFGTDFLGCPFFKNTPAFRMATLQPGLQDAFHYGDSGGTGGTSNYNFRATARHKLGDLNAAILEHAKAQPNSFQFGWFSIVWFDPSLTGSIDNVSRHQFFDDIGIATARDGWNKQDVAMMFKCAPYGGHSLNKFRNENGFKYINVAHDDPDANMFTLYARGAMLADDDRYATDKITSSHNTILVNGKGQKGEGQHWTQPLKGPDEDMSNLARVTAWKDTKDVVFVEGEAGKLYPALSGYRRSILWVEGGYILVLDDITASAGQSADYTWLMQGKQVEITDAASGKFRLANGDANCPLSVVADPPFTASVAPSTAKDRDRLLGFQQLQLKASAPRWRLVSLFDPWNRQAKLTASPTADGMSIKVEGADINDTWTWQKPADDSKPSRISGQRAGKWQFGL